MQFADQEFIEEDSAMSKVLLSRLLVLAALASFVGGVLPMAGAAGGRRYPYRNQSSTSAASRQQARRAPAASGSQSYRRYSAAPTAAAPQGPTRSATSRRGRSGYGPNDWRADRKVLGY